MSTHTPSSASAKPPKTPAVAAGATAPALKRSAVEAGKSKTSAAKTTVAVPTIYHGSILLYRLPVDFKKVYYNTVRRFLSPAQQQHVNPNVRMLDEVGTATLCVEVDNKATAQQLCRQLQNRKVLGRRWKAQYVPATATKCHAEACLVNCFLIPAAFQTLAERALRDVPGFLSFIDTPDEPLPATAAAAVASPIHDADDDSGAEDGEAGQCGSEKRHKLLVSFADEGSALHARALFSGRLVGKTGVRMFLERRHPSAEVPQEY